MTTTTALILGILIGWLIEWVIDWVYWRRKCDERVKAVREQYKDPLEIISGIGPVITQKLYDAGIYTFEDLAALTQADMENIIGEDIKNLADEEDLIKQAKHFAKEKARARKAG